MNTTCTCILLRKASRKVTAFYDAALAPAGIGVAQYSLLRRIRHLGQPSLTELARESDLDRSTIGRNVRVLERMDLVRLAHGEDQREATVSILPRGADLVVMCEPLWEEAQRNIEDTIGAEAVDALRRFSSVL